MIDGADYNVWNLEPLEKDILPSSDYVIDGTMSTEAIVENIIYIIEGVRNLDSKQGRNLQSRISNNINGSIKRANSEFYGRLL